MSCSPTDKAEIGIIKGDDNQGDITTTTVSGTLPLGPRGHWDLTSSETPTSMTSETPEVAPEVTSRTSVSKSGTLRIITPIPTKSYKDPQVSSSDPDDVARGRSSDAGRSNGHQRRQKLAADELLVSIARMSLRDVAVRVADCDDVNAAWHSRLEDADAAVCDVRETCQRLIRRNQQSERTYRMLQGENTRLQERVQQTNDLLESAVRHRFTPDVDVTKPGHMVKRLLATLPPSSFE